MSVFGDYRRHAFVVIWLTVVALLIDVLFYVTRWAPGILSPEGEVRPHQGDWHIPVIISILLSAAAGLAWYPVARRLSGLDRTAAFYLSYLLFWMAIDDFLAIHEKIERFSGVDWLVIYLPIMGLAALDGLYLVRRSLGLPGARHFRLWAVIGAAGWFFSQILEGIGQFWDDARYHAMELIVPEEMLETIGSAALALAGLALLVALRQQQRAGSSHPMIRESSRG